LSGRTDSFEEGGSGGCREADGTECGIKRRVGTGTGAQEAMRQVRFRCFEQERKEEELRDEESVLEKGSHPYGVQPMGNMYTGIASCIRAGLGAFAPLADQAVLDLLEMLDARRLGLLICCSRALYIFAHHDELWRALVLNVFGGDFDFKSSWKDTFGYRFLNQDYRLHVPRKFAGLYSDLLFQPWLCASMVKDYIFPLFCCCVLLSVCLILSLFSLSLFASIKDEAMR